MLRRFMPKALILALAVILSGCSLKPEDSSSEVNNSSSEVKESSSEAKESVTFTDALGREVSVEKNPQRTAALLGSFADVWQLSGGNVCAAPEDAWSDFDLELPDAVNIGGAHSPGLEALLGSEPDFVIASSSTSADVDMCDQLEAAGITVAYFDVDCFEDYLKMLEICTDITGRKDLYEKNGTKVSEEIQRIKEDLESQNVPAEKKRVLILRAASGFVKAKGSEGTILGEMLSDLGCENIADSDKSLLENLSMESIIAQNPYHVFVVTMGSDTEAALSSYRQLITDNPAWNSLEAVMEERVHIMDKKLFNIKPNENWAVAYEELSKILSQ